MKMDEEQKALNRAQKNLIIAMAACSKTEATEVFNRCEKGGLFEAEKK
jgi:predicted lactoylglutathione lyase